MNLSAGETQAYSSADTVDPKLVVVSLHDVAPPFAEDIERQVDALGALGVSRFALKVVPNWHGQHPLSQLPGFTSRLVQWERQGAEVVLHGLEHRPRGRWRGSPQRLTRARMFAPSAAEFMTLGGAEARESVVSGLAELETAGLSRTETFCAPGWLMTDEAEDGVAEAGIRLVTGMFSLHDLSARRLWWIPSRGYMGTGNWSERGVGALNLIASSAIGRACIRKVYLHPDPSGRQRWRRALAEIRTAVETGWTPATFGQVAARLGR